MTTPGDLVVKALTAGGGALAAAAAAHSVRTDNVNEKTASIGHAESLGKVAKDTGKFQQGLDSLQKTNAEPSAFDAYGLAAEIPSGIIKAEPKLDPLSTMNRDILGTESVQVTTAPGALARLQNQREAKLTETSASAQISTEDFVEVKANEVQPPSEGAESLQGGWLVPPNPPVSTSEGKKPRGPSNFASLSQSNYGRGSKFSELISPSPQERPTISSSPPACTTLSQFALVILSGVVGALLTWHGLRFLCKPSK